MLSNFGMGVGENLLSGLITSQLTGGAPNVPNVPQLPNQPEAAATALQGIGDLQNPYQATLPLDLAYLQTVADNPYAASLQRGADNASFASNQGGQAALLAGLGGYGAANQVLNTGFDPRMDLYNRMFQQNQQQNLASQEAQGVGSTPYGAGLTDQANANFNMDWQNQQLQRQLAALGGYGAANQQAGGQLQGAADLFQQAGQLPWQTYQQQPGADLAALQAYQGAGANANVVPQQQIADLLQYLGMGASNANAQLGAFDAASGQQREAAAGLYPLVSQGVQAGVNYFNQPSAPQASFGGSYAQPVAPVDTGLSNQTLPYIPDMGPISSYA